MFQLECRKLEQLTKINYEGNVAVLKGDSCEPKQRAQPLLHIVRHVSNVCRVQAINYWQITEEITEKQAVKSSGQQQHAYDAISKLLLFSNFVYKVVITSLEDTNIFTSLNHR